MKTCHREIVLEKNLSNGLTKKEKNVTIVIIFSQAKMSRLNHIESYLDKLTITTDYRHQQTNAEATSTMFNPRKRASKDANDSRSVESNPSVEAPTDSIIGILYPPEELVVAINTDDDNYDADDDEIWEERKTTAKEIYSVTKKCVDYCRKRKIEKIEVVSISKQIRFLEAMASNRPIIDIADKILALDLQRAHHIDTLRCICQKIRTCEKKLNELMQ